MNKHNPKTGADQGGVESRERIKRAAIKLFAKRGYHATGMRKLAAEAEVNVAMINYFFGSKKGLLKELLDDFFGPILAMGRELASANEPIEDRLRRFIKAAVAYYQTNSEMLIVFLTMAPHDDPTVIQFKAAWAKQMYGLLNAHLAQPVQEVTGRRFPLEVVGPGLVSLMASHFLLRPVVQEVGKVQFGDDFYQAYPDIIADLFLNGLNGLCDLNKLDGAIND